MRNISYKLHNPALTSLSIPSNQSSLTSLITWRSHPSPVPQSLQLSDTVWPMFLLTGKLDWDNTAFLYLRIFGNIVFCYQCKHVWVFCNRLEMQWSMIPICKRSTYITIQSYIKWLPSLRYTTNTFFITNGDRSKRQFFRTIVVDICHLGTENRFELDWRNICCVV